MFRKFPFKDDWFVNNEIFDDAIAYIEKNFKIDRTHDVPYVAGYSKDWKTIYIDKDLPTGFKNKKGKKIDTDKYLTWHEVLECTLLDRFKGDKLWYQMAHQIALRSERDAVEADGIDWKEYNNFFNKYIKKIADLTEYSDVPKDLDLKPYYDEDDYEALRKMVGGRKNFKQFLKDKKS
jgi:hypothetical protein